MNIQKKDLYQIASCARVRIKDLKQKNEAQWSPILTICNNLCDALAFDEEVNISDHPGKAE